MELRRKNVIVKSIKDLGEGRIRAVVATEDIDRDGEILKLDGLNIKSYLNNPVVAWAHRYDEPAIAKTLSLKKRDGQLEADMEFAINEYDFAHTIYKLYKGGFMRAFSIGFMPEEIQDNQITKSEMYEYSAVLVPANPKALAMAKSAGIDTDLLEKIDEGAHIEKSVEQPEEVVEELDIESKSGKVLSKKTRQIIESAKNSLESLLKADSEEEETDKDVDEVKGFIEITKKAVAVAEEAISQPAKKAVKIVRLIRAKKAMAIADKGVEQTIKVIKSKLGE